jgi:hypothetical protein
MRLGEKTETNALATDDDDDLDEANIPGFTYPTLSAPGGSPSAPAKGKGRAPEQLAPSGASASSSPPLAGIIGTRAPDNARRFVGGVQVETRCVDLRMIIIVYLSF